MLILAKNAEIMLLVNVFTENLVKTPQSCKKQVNDKRIYAIYI